MRCLASEDIPEAAPERYPLVVVSNRTPAFDGRLHVGGLVSALEPALRDEHAVWLGWSGEDGAGVDLTVDVRPSPPRARFDLPAAVRQPFYAGFCNRVLWPLFHGFVSLVRYDEREWDAYVDANERFARRVLELADRDATIWVHDYHLLLVAQDLRRAGHRGRIGLFLHIPFPPREVLETLPCAALLLEAMHQFDVLGFQTERHAQNFRTAVHGAAYASRPLEVGVFPATIDTAPFRTVAPELGDVAKLRVSIAGQRVVLGVDRLDYSKGIPERLEAFERMLETFPEVRGTVTFVQIAVPSRTEVEEYSLLQQRVDALVGRINGRFADVGWVPVRYLRRALSQDVLAQLYRLADVALVTPLCDGMNLVAKEFVAAQDSRRPGVLVLSRYAGAADNLPGAVVTNPYHREGLARDIYVALRMTATERSQRYATMSSALDGEGDARAWARSFLDRLAGTSLGS